MFAVFLSILDIFCKLNVSLVSYKLALHMEITVKIRTAAVSVFSL